MRNTNEGLSKKNTSRALPFTALSTGLFSCPNHRLILLSCSTQSFFPHVPNTNSPPGWSFTTVVFTGHLCRGFHHWTRLPAVANSRYALSPSQYRRFFVPFTEPSDSDIDTNVAPSAGCIIPPNHPRNHVSHTTQFNGTINRLSFPASFALECCVSLYKHRELTEPDRHCEVCSIKVSTAITQDIQRFVMRPSHHAKHQLQEFYALHHMSHTPVRRNTYTELHLTPPLDTQQRNLTHPPHCTHTRSQHSV